MAPGQSGIDYTSMLKAFAADAVQIRRKLDESYIEQLQAASVSALMLVDALPQTAEALLPRRPGLVRSNMTLETEVRHVKDVSTGVSAGVALLPLSISYQRRFATEKSTASQVCIEITSQPVSFTKPKEE